MAEPNGRRLPHWFYIARAVAMLATGILIFLQQAFGDDVPNIVLMAAALLLLGFSASDLSVLWRTSGGGRG